MILSHLGRLCSVSVETSVRSFQLFQGEPVDRSYQHVSNVLLSGIMFKFSLSTSICVFFPQRCLPTSVYVNRNLQIVFLQSVKVAVPIMTLFSGPWTESSQTTHLSH